jgi:HSP20 family molecular chaperone IbpA
MFYNRTQKDLFLNTRTWLERNEKTPFNYELPYALEKNLELRVPCADVLELDDQFILELALPGVNLDDIEIKVEEQVLTVIAKRTPTMFEEKAIYLQKELPTHFMFRQFEFECEILTENIEARLERGLLYISVPKLEVALRIPVSVGMLEGHYTNNLKTRVGKQAEHRTHKEIAIK